MVFVSFIIILVISLVYRALLLGLPFFWDAFAQHPFANLVSGLASDLAILAVVGVLALIASWPEQRRWRRPLDTLAFASAVLTVAFLATHLRYVEHFGMNVRPYHFDALATDDMWTVGTAMVLQSWRATSLLALGVVLLVWAWRRSKAAAARAPSHSWQRRMSYVGVALAIAAACNALYLNRRFRPGTHLELRSSPLMALYYNLRDDEAKRLPYPTEATALNLRELLSRDRDFHTAIAPKQLLGAGPGAVVAKSDAALYPLWQGRIASGATDAAHDRLRADMRKFLADGVREHGPWNVLVVIAESLRAEELQAFGNEEPSFANLSPNISRMARDGVAFTEVMSAGLRTHTGITATQCSLLTGDDFTIVRAAPMARAVCLTDIFARRGFETHFFYPADNHFDNQETFFKRHRTQFVHGQRDMPMSSAQAGWGYSDRALFQYATSVLAKAPSPWFATVLTLTNHAPFRIPDDVPAGLIDQNRPIRDQMVQYVDAALGELYDEVSAKMPHTLIVVVADHGRFWDETVGLVVPDYSLLRRVARIPLLVVAKGMPEKLRGRTVDKLASNADLAPTLMSVLGWSKLDQQFMGEDAFSRSGPVYIDWQNELLQIKSAKVGEPFVVRRLEDRYDQAIMATGLYNLLAPPHEEEEAKPQ